MNKLIQLSECKVYPNSFHVNQVCHRKHTSCHRFSFPAEYFKTREEKFKKEGLVILNPELLEVVYDRVKRADAKV